MPAARPGSVKLAREAHAPTMNRAPEHVDSAAAQMLVEMGAETVASHAHQADSEIKEADALLALQQVVGLDRDYADERGAD
jgi:hypothetical protein